MPQDPFVYTSGYTTHIEEVWADGGIQPVSTNGCHAVFAARVPFIPSFLSADFTRMVGGGLTRIDMIHRRQVSFISDLANAREHSATFELRLISRPRPDRPEQNDVDVVFLGKVFHENRRRAQEAALQLWERFRAHFPSEDPFNYPLVPVTTAEEFDACFEPVPFDQVRPINLMEIQKFEDRDPLVGNEASLLGYHVHPFKPGLDVSALSRLLETLAAQPQLCLVSISIRPTMLFEGELRTLNQMLNNYEKLAVESEGWLKHYRAERLKDMWMTYDRLINERSHLVTINIQVAGERYAPPDLVDALGSELMDNTGAVEPRRWARVSPDSEAELAIARANLKLLEQQIWKESPIESRARRLRFLATPYEAAGGFRLPIPPESGYLPGVVVKDEPFVLPTDLTPPRPEEQVVSLGEIYHRGTPTGEMFYLSVHDLRRHALVAGSTGSGKTNTCLHLLSSLWKEYRIPFLVVYPIDKPDYRLLMADPGVRDDLLIFTLGDDTTAPFRFNPFHVPAGVLLRTHMSQLMRSFMAAYEMWDPLPAVYREALRQVYIRRGWDVVNGRGGDPGVEPPTLSEFYETIIQVAEKLTQGYGSEVKGNIRQGAEIRIRDLLESTGHVLNVREPAPFREILQRPTVMEIGRVGSSEDIALLMGFMIMWLTEELQSVVKTTPLEQRRQIHLTLLEEAHRVMSSGVGMVAAAGAALRAKGAEEFSNILAEVRGFNEGILIAEQIPTSLVLGAVGNTHLKIMHWLEDERSFNLFGDILNLDKRQRDYVRTLGVGEAIIRGKMGRPIHVKVANYLDQFQTPTDQPIIDDSDQAVREFMRGKVTLPTLVPWETIGAPVVRKWGDAACAYCQVPCAYGERVEGIPRTAAQEDARRLGAASARADIAQVRSLALERVRQAGLSANLDAAYCYFARIAALPAKGGKSNLETYSHVAQTLAAFHTGDGGGEST